MQNKGWLTAKRSRASDECYTPKYAVLPVLEFLNKKWTIWCPFDDEKSEFVKVLKHNGYKVIYSHINGGKDFFEYEPTQSYDVIVSNPPYSIKDGVINRCYKLNKKFMLLLPLPTLQGKTRYKNFVNGLELLVFDGRISYFANGHTDKIQDGNSFASCYFCHNVLPEKLIFRELSIYQNSVENFKYANNFDHLKHVSKILKN